MTCLFCKKSAFLDIFDALHNSCAYNDIKYEPLISPFLLAFEEDEDEFDFMLHLSELLRSKGSIVKFTKAISKINF